MACVCLCDRKDSSQLPSTSWSHVEVVHYTMLFLVSLAHSYADVVQPVLCNSHNLSHWLKRLTLESPEVCFSLLPRRLCYHSGLYVCVSVSEISKKIMNIIFWEECLSAGDKSICCGDDPVFFVAPRFFSGNLPLAKCCKLTFCKVLMEFNEGYMKFWRGITHVISSEAAD